MSALEVAAALLLALGVFIMWAGALGLVRFPDLYTRLHAAGKADTLGQGLVLSALMLSAGVSTELLKLLLIVGFIFIFNPTATHALARAAWTAGLRPWIRGDGSQVEQFEGQMQGSEREQLLLPVHAAPTVGERDLTDGGPAAPGEGGE